MSNNFKDVFSNSSNDYIYPGLSPCPNVADDQYLRWTEEGLAIIKGTEEIALIGFNDLGIPVNSFNKQQIVLEGGEVSFIPGLDKGLCKKKLGFTMPSLVSTDEDLNEYFMQIDLSVNYYKNFSLTYSNIDVSASYSQNVSISDALNIALGKISLKITSSYDPSVFYFEGTQEGYEFNISNFSLSIIDTSENTNSPFGNGVNSNSYDLIEDPSVFIPNAKYPNTAMQGIILRGIFPDQYGVTTLLDKDKWFNLNHVSDYIVTYPSTSITYPAEVSTNLSIKYDPSTFIGNKPIIDDTSCFISDISIGDIDSSITYTDASIDSSIISNATFTNCIINNSSLGYSFINKGTIVDTSIYFSDIYDATIASSYIEQTFLQGDATYFDTISSSIIEDSSIKNYILNSSNIHNSYILDSSVVNGDGSINIYDNTAIFGGSILRSDFVCAEIIDASISNSYFTRSTLNNTDIYDSSIMCNTNINNQSTINDSFILNVLTNESGFDTSLNRVIINTTLIWDSSLNNTDIYDSSIYNTYITDSSLIRCTTYNCSFDSSTSLIDSREIKIDSSINAEFEILNDTSTYYLRNRKKLEIGNSGSSTEGIISAGDYLNWVTINNNWKRIGDMYIWTSATDDDDCTIKNLIDGFYVYNPHEFPIQIEYLTFV